MLELVFAWGEVYLGCTGTRVVPSLFFRGEMGSAGLAVVARSVRRGRVVLTSLRQC